MLYNAWVPMCADTAGGTMPSTRRPDASLRVHPAEGPDESAAGLDPDRPVVEEDLFEPMAPSHRDMMRAGVRRIRWRFRRPGRRERSAVNPPMTVAGTPPAGWILLVQSLRRLVAPAVAFLLLFGLAMGLYALLRLLF